MFFSQDDVLFPGAGKVEIWGSAVDASLIVCAVVYVTGNKEVVSVNAQSWG